MLFVVSEGAIRVVRSFRGSYSCCLQFSELFVLFVVSEGAIRVRSFRGSYSCCSQFPKELFVLFVVSEGAIRVVCSFPKSYSCWS